MIDLWVETERGAGSTTLRPACVADADALAPFARAAFDAAFGHLYAPDDLAAFFAAERSAARYRSQLADPMVRCRIAERDGEIAAYCLIVRGKQVEGHPAPRPARPVFLSQLYCAAGETGRGIGAALLAWAVEDARVWGADAITLSVFSGNRGAQAFYLRHGFAKVSDIDFWVGTHRDDEYLYERRLEGLA